MVEPPVCSVWHNCLVFQKTANSLLVATTPNRTLRYGYCMQHECCGGKRFVSQALIVGEANVNKPSANDWPPLHQATLDRDLQKVEVKRERILLSLDQSCRLS